MFWCWSLRGHDVSEPDGLAANSGDQLWRSTLVLTSTSPPGVQMNRTCVAPELACGVDRRRIDRRS